MRKIVALKRSAKESATWRGHSLRKFVTIPGRRAYSVCKDCGMTAWVNSKPWYNEIDAHGEAIALNCIKNKLTQ